ncbi:MAG TPA: hypothetical protein PLI21_06385, partial [Methanomassiliicoccaceae archaeon]|nr:hypothetical protein [Methanomassiliicoccaceae archaeon]
LMTVPAWGYADTKEGRVERECVDQGYSDYVLLFLSYHHEGDGEGREGPDSTDRIHLRLA